MKKVILVLIVLLIIMVSCDRYEHEPFSDVALEADMQVFFTALSSATDDSLESVMAWYSEDYLNDKDNKADIEHQYAIYFDEYGDDYEISGELNGYWNNNRIEWTLVGTSSDTSIVIAEYDDYLRAENGTYKFFGNQVSPPELDPSRPVVLVQYFTSEFCGNCPVSSLKLEEMEDEYGEQIVLIEYVSSSDPGGLYSPESDYYGVIQQPSSIFSGEFKIVGAGEANLGEYESRYAQITERDIDFRFTEMDLTAGLSSIDVSVSWEMINEIAAEELMIKAVILEEDPGLNYVFDNSVYFSNRAIAGYEEAFNGETTEVIFTIESSIEMPEDCSVVVWLQNLPEVWESAVVYNVIKKHLGE